MRQIILVLLVSFLLTPRVALAHVGGQLDVNILSQGVITIQNTISSPIKCRLMALGDVIWFEIDGSRRYTTKPLRVDVKYHQISLYCLAIDKVTKRNPWRINPYKDKPPLKPKVFRL